MKKLILLMSTTAILGGCGIYTKYERPTDLPATDSLANADIKRSTDTLPAWRDFFTDAQLQALIAKGLQQNTSVRTAQLQVTIAQQSLKMARQAFIPSLTLAPEGTVAYNISGKTVSPQTYNLQLASSWQIDAFGALRNANRSAQAQVEQSIAYRQAVETQITAAIAASYYTLQLLDAQLQVSEQTKLNWQNSVTTMRALMEAGGANEAAVAQTEATYLSVCASVEDLKKSIHDLEDTFCALLGETPHHIARSAWNGTQNTLMRFADNGVPLHLLAQRPDVRQAEAGLASAFYATNQARSAFYPSINLSGTLGWTNNLGSAIVNPAQWLLAALGSITQPIFQNGRIRAQYKINQAQQEAAKLAFSQKLLDAGVEVNAALSKMQAAKNKETYYKTQVEALQRAEVSTQLLMDHGNSTYLEVLTARQTLLSARLADLANEYDAVQGYIDLFQALGGGCDTASNQ